MKRSKLISVVTGVGLLIGCSNEAPGSGSASGGSETGTGGSFSGGQAGAGSGGVPGSGGNPGNGGTSSGGSQLVGGGSETGGTNSSGGGGASSSGASGGSSGGASGSSGASSGGSPSSGGSSLGGAGGATGGQAAGGTAASSGAGATGFGGNTGGAMGSGGSSGTTTHWVGTWTASPYPVAAADQPPASLSNSVLRQVAHVSLGGSKIKVQFSNLSGNGPVTINSAHIALCTAVSAVDGSIDPATDKALTFAGATSLTMAQGTESWSDPIDFTVPPLGNISITTAFGSVPTNLTGHAGSRTTSYQQSGSSNVSAANMTAAQKADHWYYISAIDVMADASAVGVVAIGDSITDGRGTDTNKNNRWTDRLSARLRANAATSKVAVMNQGIGATNLIGSSGTAAEARFSRDVLGQSGVKYAIVFDGVNDISEDQTFAAMKSAYDKLIQAAHAKGLLIYGATILPFGGHSFYSESHESVRQQVNTYIKSGAFDGYIDFDAALTDGGNPPKLQSTYAAWAQMDGLHPGPTGYQKMGDSVDLTLFSK